MKHSITLLLLVLFSCQSSDKSLATYNIESVASAKGTEVFQDNWDNIRENYKFPWNLYTLGYIFYSGIWYRMVCSSHVYAE